MLTFGWVGGTWQSGCSDLKIRWFQRIFYYECSDSWVGGWVTTNPNIVRIFKSEGNNELSLMLPHIKLVYLVDYLTFDLYVAMEMSLLKNHKILQVSAE